MIKLDAGRVLVCGQKIALGRVHAGQTLAIAVSGTTVALELGDAGTRVVRRTTTTPVRNIKAGRPRAASGPGTSSRTQVPHGLVKDT
jgi:hypothetical protein